MVCRMKVRQVACKFDFFQNNIIYVFSYCFVDLKSILVLIFDLFDQPGEPRAQSSPHRTSYTNGNGSTLQDMPITPPISPTDDLERGRTKRKSRDFFGTIKRRLGRSKTRTKSMDRSMIPIDADNPHGELRSISADRGALMNNMNNQSNSSTGKFSIFLSLQFFLYYFWCRFLYCFGYFVVVGPRLIVPTLDQSRRSSLSESSAISGLSSASTKTYLHEASTLVLETLENGVKRFVVFLLLILYNHFFVTDISWFQWRLHNVQDGVAKELNFISTMIIPLSLNI